MRKIPDEPEGKASAEEAGRIKETTVPSISRLVALGSLAPEDVKAFRKFPEPPSFAVHPTRPSHIPNVVEKRVPNNYQIPLSLATAVVSAHSQAKKELGIRRSGLRSYMQSICSFCLGHDADWDINELSAQLPEWSELIALASPLLSRETTNNPREIGRKMSAIESVAG